MLQRWLFRSRPRLISRTSTRQYRTKGSRNKHATTTSAKTASVAVQSDKRSLNKASPTKSLGIPIVNQGSEHHHDLASFLKYAKRVTLSETSTVYVGTHYEYTVAETLWNFGFELTRTGRQSDRGIDLIGHWHIPHHPGPIRVILQCKAHAKKLAPQHIRELEGSFPGAPAGWQGDGVLGFLVAMSPSTKGMRDALIRSRLPMGFMQLSREGKVLQFLWNQEATKWGLEGLGVKTRFTAGSKVGEGENEIGLTWNDWMLTRDRLGLKVSASKVKTRTPKTASTKVETQAHSRGNPTTSTEEIAKAKE